MRYRTGKYTVCRSVRPSFNPEILQAGAVKGLIVLCRVWSCMKIIKLKEALGCWVFDVSVVSGCAEAC